MDLAIALFWTTIRGDWLDLVWRSEGFPLFPAWFPVSRAQTLTVLRSDPSVSQPSIFTYCVTAYPQHLWIAHGFANYEGISRGRRSALSVSVGVDKSALRLFRLSLARRFLLFVLFFFCLYSERYSACEDISSLFPGTRWQIYPPVKSVHRLCVACAYTFCCARRSLTNPSSQVFGVPLPGDEYRGPWYPRV
jgi:hypothetical protein